MRCPSRSLGGMPRLPGLVQRRLCRTAAGWAALCVLATACQRETPRPPLAASAERPALPNAARRIVSLSPALTEVLFAVGCGAALVARDGWSDYPPAALKAQKLSGLVPPVEAVVAARPDLVLSHFPPQRLRAGLDAAGVVWRGLAPQRLDEVAATFSDIGRLCGRPADGAALSAAWQQAVADVRAARKDGPHPSVYLELDPGGGRPHTVGRGTFLDDVIQAAGGRNVMADAGRWLQVSTEQVLTAAPDVILLTVAARDAPARVAALRARAGWQRVPAVRSGRIFTVDPDLMSRPGPRLLVGLRAVARHLSPRALPPYPARLRALMGQ